MRPLFEIETRITSYSTDQATSEEKSPDKLSMIF